MILWGLCQNNFSLLGWFFLFSGCFSIFICAFYYISEKLIKYLNSRVLVGLTNEAEVVYIFWIGSFLLSCFWWLMELFYIMEYYKHHSKYIESLCWTIILQIHKLIKQDLLLQFVMPLGRCWKRCTYILSIKGFFSICLLFF